ncbi:MAG TPA: LysR family transcriptional regulator [Acidobacteriaceae bacterium]
MDFEQLKTFLEVWRQKSFSRAAEKLLITQPAVSAQIRSLEKEMGAALFDRKGGKVTFTAAGRVFEPFAEHSVETQRHIMMTIAELQRSPRGEISVSANESTSLYVLPNVFAEFKKQYTKVSLTIVRSDKSRTMEALINREVDFGVVSLPIKDQRFKVETISKDEIVLVVPTGHPLCKSAKVTLEQLARFPLLLPKTGRQRELLDNIFRMHDYHPRTVMEVESSELLKRFIIAGLGMGFLPRNNVLEDAKAGVLCITSVEGVRLGRDLGLIYLKDKTLTRAAQSFLDIATGVQER